VRRAAIEEQNQLMLRRQQEFRRAADVVTDAWTAFAEVQAVAVVGSVAKALWKEIPRFSDFRRAGIEVWHECADLDLALWIRRNGLVLFVAPLHRRSVRPLNVGPEPAWSVNNSTSS
jgi:hypothetical protein